MKLSKTEEVLRITTPSTALALNRFISGVPQPHPAGLPISIISEMHGLIPSARSHREATLTILSLIKYGVVVIGSRIPGEVRISIAVSESLSPKIDVGKIVESVKKIIDSYEMGGTSTFAQIAGTRSENLELAFECIRKQVNNKIAFERLCS